ncbi:MAG TPA: hypothetical protein VFG50_03080 [Rhodothermales bacterium]|nr:hypothetical protein [Rhodothermales bacterium]
MKRSVFFLGCLLALVPLSAFAQGQRAADLPESIKTYYHQRNLAAAISTPSERIAVVAQADTSLSERLRRVDRLLQLLAEREVAVDPSFTIDPGIISNPEMLGNPSFERVFVPAQLTEVVAVHRVEPDLLNVEVAVYDIQPADNLLFIQMYENGKNVEPMHLSTVSSVVNRQTHTWRLFRGHWLRQPFAMVPIEK